MASAGDADAHGGGVFGGNLVTLDHSTVDRNAIRASTDGGNAATSGGGVNGASVSATASTVSRNSLFSKTAASKQAAIFGGGIAISAGGANTIKNSTIALNRATAISPKSGGTSLAVGAGIEVDPDITSLVDDTIVGNVVSITGGTRTVRGGGLYGGPGVTLLGTIIANNKAPVGPDCYDGPRSKGHNLIGKTAGCSFTKKSTDKVNTSARLGSLASNGGPTQTVGIKATSPAHNAIPPASCPLHTDQRGVHRPQGPKCDIGAFELKPGELTS